MNELVVAVVVVSRAVKQYIAIQYSIFANNNNILGDASNI